MSKPPSDEIEIGQEETGKLDEPATDEWSAERSRQLNNLLASVETKLAKGDFKASVGDFIRLLQLRKEMSDENTKEITVRWVEPSEEENAPA